MRRGTLAGLRNGKWSEIETAAKRSTHPCIHINYAMYSEWSFLGGGAYAADATSKMPARPMWGILCSATPRICVGGQDNLPN